VIAVAFVIAGLASLGSGMSGFVAGSWCYRQFPVGSWPHPGRVRHRRHGGLPALDVGAGLHGPTRREVRRSGDANRLEIFYVAVMVRDSRDRIFPSTLTDVITPV